MTDRVLILDFGSQVTQPIARRLREAGVYCEILPFNASDERIRAFAPKTNVDHISNLKALAFAEGKVAPCPRPTP